MVLFIPPPSEQATAKAYLHPSSGLSQVLISVLGKRYLCIKKSLRRNLALLLLYASHSFSASISGQIFAIPESLQNKVLRSPAS